MNGLETEVACFPQGDAHSQVRAFIKGDAGMGRLLHPKCKEDQNNDYAKQFSAFHRLISDGNFRQEDVRAAIDSVDC